MQYYSCIAVLFLAFVTICYSSFPINHICVTPNNDNAYCTPVPTELIQYLSLRSPYTCGAESQKVSYLKMSIYYLHFNMIMSFCGGNTVNFVAELLIHPVL